MAGDTDLHCGNMQDDPLQMENVQDIFEHYNELRACPIKHSSAQGGFYWLTRYNDVRNAALDFKSFSSGLKGVRLPPALASGRLKAIEYDPPEHGLWRKLYLEALTPANLKDIAPRLRAAANRLIDRFAESGSCDLMKDFAMPLPVLGVCEAIGMSGVSVTKIQTLSTQFAQSRGEQQFLAVQKIGALVLEEIHARRANPGDDYMSKVALAEIGGDVLSDADIAAFMVGFFVAGHETTTSTLGTLFFHTLPRDDLKARMLADDKAMSAAIEEAVRLYAPFQAFHRTATDNIVVGDATISAGSTVRLCYGSANRDPDAFENPDQFDIDRTANTHLGFGFGRHVCVGAPLARLEIAIGMRELLRRLPDIRLMEAAPDWQIQGGTLISPKTCRVEFTPQPIEAHV